MSLCPTCKASFSGGEQFCPRDGTPLRSALPEDPLAGRVLSGRYRLIEVLGRGGMGAVYRAHHILMDKPVAVKVLRQELASDTEAVARFHREARSASRLDHDHIIRVSDFGQTDDGLLFLVMELLDGENLAQVLRRGPLAWRRAATITRDIALGLAHAHEQGVIHRDLKPENIVLVRRGKSARQLVKVLDFGLAKLIHDVGGGTSESDGAEDEAARSLTRTGAVFGTPEYMSPEQAEGRALGPRTDLYALGVVAYQMVSGALPFSAPTFLALIAKTVNEPPQSPTQQNPSVEIPPTFEVLIMQCLAKDPAGRPASADEIAETLDQLLAAHYEDPKQSSEVGVVVPPGVRGAAGSGPVASGKLVSDAAAEPAGGVAKTVQRNLSPGQVPYGTPATSAVASAYAAVLGETARTGGSARPGSGQQTAERRAAEAESSSPGIARAAELTPASSGRTPARGTAGGASGPGAGVASGSNPGRSGAAAGVGTGLASGSNPGRRGVGAGLGAGVAPGPISGLRPSAMAATPASQSAPEDPEEGTAAKPADQTTTAALEDEPLVVPRRPYWLVALGVAMALATGAYLIVPRWIGKPTPVAASNVSEAIRKARELLSPARIANPGAVDEALGLLLVERQSHNSPELQRLLSVAYEAQSNRLRALGHLHLAVRLAGDTSERPVAQLALAQLLARMGHGSEACQAAQRVLHERPPANADLRKNASALANTLSCSGK